MQNQKQFDPKRLRVKHKHFSSGVVEVPINQKIEDRLCRLPNKANPNVETRKEEKVS